MKKQITLIALLLGLASFLAGLEVYSPDAKPVRMPLSELRQAKLVSFETIRDKDGAIISETWEGIPLLPWLDSMISTDWQNLKVQSKDGYIINFSRLELSEGNIFLALRHNGTELSEYDIRIIHTSSRENAWVRNLESLKLEDFLPYPQPKHIYEMDNWLQEHIKLLKSSSVSFAELLPKAFSLESADLIFVDSKGRKLRMNYPRDLAKARLSITDNGELEVDLGNLKLPGLSSDQSLDEIIYFQAGALAVIKQSKINTLAELAKELGWKSGQLFLVKAKRKAISTKDLSRQNWAKGWLELER